MSLTHTNPDQQRFTDATQLKAVLTTLIQEKSKGDMPFVLGVAGGSASGKTTLARKLVAQLDADHIGLFSQDLFQLGSDFAERKTSPYKWDDPKNFDLEACQRALAGLRAGRTVTVPNFDVVANVRQGEIDIAPKPCIVWEGVYAFLTQELQEAVDVSVFVDAPFMLRLLRRISRFLQRDAIDDISTPARQMLTFVLQADTDFVRTQKSPADFVLEVGLDSVTEEIAVLRQRAARHLSLMAQLPNSPPQQSVQFAGLAFNLYNQTFAILDTDGQPIYATALDETTAAQALKSLRIAID